MLKVNEPAAPQVLVLPPGLREEIQSRNRGMIVGYHQYNIIYI